MAVSDKFQLYSGGVYSSSAIEDKAGLNHAVAAVGYDSSSVNGYLLIKNSWGVRWGENGFFRVQYGKKALGIGSAGAYPIA
jgi:C1A family cysteine protease